MSNMNVENISNIVSIAVGCFTIISVLIAFVSFVYSRERKKREKAIELAHYYQKSILPLIKYLDVALSNSMWGCLSYIHKIFDLHLTCIFAFKCLKMR